ncbi:MAG: hypothetical protein DCC56_15225 [Anaerolineae bacterium]|nr:MAG: hypothetical protein DCC56_15225 [Anaerolineae bacterium]WKZ42437.1 MAG: hypothetical protein QY302_10060 [Anaerolineales bacterium]
MTESTEKNERFLGAYFDRDGVIKLSRWADILSWVTLTIYVLTWLFSVLLFMSQYVNGMMGDKGMSFLMGMNMFSPFLTQALPGVFYFFGLQAVSKILLIMLDVEDNTRRAARK